MKTVIDIFTRDIKRIFRNKAATLILVGICLLPSLYAWFNIAANYDPYSNTQGIKIAVANNDEGAETDLISMNAGQEVVDNLKENTQLGWIFVDEETAKKGVKSGEYYAAIIIPEDFSDSLLSVLSGELKTPELDYYINEKKNAIAPKMTDTGATTIQQQINDTFTSVASEAITEIISSAVTDLSGDVNDGKSELTTTISMIQDNLDDFQELSEKFQSTIATSKKSINNALNTLDDVSSLADSGTQVLEKITALTTESRNAINDFSSVFSASISDGEDLITDLSDSASSKLADFETQVDQLTTDIENSIDAVSTLNKRNSEIITKLTNLHNQIGSDSSLSNKIGLKLSELQAQNASFQKLLNSLNKGNSSLNSIAKMLSGTGTDLNELTSDAKTSLRGYRNNFENTTLPQITDALDSISTINGSLTAALEAINPMSENLKETLSQLETTLNDCSSVLNQASDAMAKVQPQLDNVIADISALQSSEAYQQLLSLEGVDSEAISDFMGSPVSIKSEILFDVDTYGSGMTPFYTNLAIWVGGLVLVSILKQEVDKEGLRRRFTATQGFFGRWLLFVCAALVQALIVCLGDIFLIKIQCLHPVYFVLAGLFCSFVYVTLIYSLAVAFKHIGKAIAVILIILQIPGSSGTYPIEMMPEFFQKLCPFFPFTYGIKAMRECIAGFYHYDYIKNLLVMIVFILLALFIGLVLRPLLQNLNYTFDKSLAETDLMICETETSEKSTPRIQMMLKALSQDENVRKNLIERAAKFENNYSKRVKEGFSAMVIIPLIFLLLMFGVESKLVFLILWIISLIGIAVYLICLVYFHEKFSRLDNLDEITEESIMEEIRMEREK